MVLLVVLVLLVLVLLVMSQPVILMRWCRRGGVRKVQVPPGLLVVLGLVVVLVLLVLVLLVLLV